MKLLLIPSFLIGSSLATSRDGFHPPPGTPGGPPGSGGPPPGTPGGGPPFGGPIVIPPFEDIPPFIQAELDRCGPVVDTHLHLATWFSTPDPLVAEMTATGIKEGIIMAVYGPSNPFGTDPNEEIAKLISASDEDDNRRLYGLASLNTTHADWPANRDFELDRLATYLEKPGMVGAKLAPPHTRLPMDSPILEEVLTVIAASSNPVLGIHIGTTPFCGPFGDFILGQKGLCEPKYVDPFFLLPFIVAFPDVTFVLMHGGQDFAGPGDPFVPFYNGTNFDHSVELASRYDNIYIEISALLDRNEEEDYAYENPLALENLRKIVDGGVQDKTIYGGDANAFPGRLLGYLNSTIVSLIDAGFNEEDRCKVLATTPLEAYGITKSDGNNGGGDGSGGGDDSSMPTSVLVHIDLYTDTFPDETTWSVNKYDGTPVGNFNGNFDSEPLSLIRTPLNLAAGATYEFVIADTSGDGICCGTYGDGRVDIKATLASGEEVLLLAVNGDFESEYSVDFTVPTNGGNGVIDPTLAPTNMPTDAPTEAECKDSFPFCFSFLCSFGTTFCEATCNVCSP